MLSRWSIRTTLTVVGIILVALTVIVGALGLTALSRSGDALDSMAHGDMVAIRTLNDSGSFLLRSRVSLDRVNALTAAGEIEQSKQVLDRAAELLGKSDENWQAFLSTPKNGIDQSLIDVSDRPEEVDVDGDGGAERNHRDLRELADPKPHDEQRQQRQKRDRVEDLDRAVEDLLAEARQAGEGARQPPYGHPDRQPDDRSDQRDAKVGAQRRRLAVAPEVDSRAQDL